MVVRLVLKNTVLLALSRWFLLLCGRPFRVLMRHASRALGWLGASALERATHTAGPLWPRSSPRAPRELICDRWESRSSSPSRRGGVFAHRQVVNMVPYGTLCIPGPTRFFFGIASLARSAGPFRIRTTRTRISQANDATHRRRRRDEQLESTKRLFNTGGRNTLRRDLGRRLDLYLDARKLLVELADLGRRERLEEACVKSR